MIVACVKNRIDAALVGACEQERVPRFWGKGMNMFALTEGKLYVVYAVQTDIFGVWYYVADDDYPEVWYPNAYPSLLFQTVDSRTSRLWRSNCLCPCPSGDDSVTIQSFCEWCNDENFYEKLVDGDNKEIKKKFEQKKEFMDLEFASEIAEGSVENVGQGWWTCSRCGGYFELEAKETEMIRCPACKKILVFPGKSILSNPQRL